VLGLGYTASAQLRLGTSDLVPNGELALSRSNGARVLRGALFHRLGVANDDWGSPLSFGASLANLLYARDEGFYYRTWGAELTGTRPQLLGGAPLQWRLFGERHRGATRKLRQTFTGADFIPNIAGERATLVGAGGDLARSFGADPTGWRLFARARTEGAWVDWSGEADGLTPGYGRALADRHPVARVRPLLGRADGRRRRDRRRRADAAAVLRRRLPDGAGPVRPPGGRRLRRQRLLARPLRARLQHDQRRPSVFFDLGWAGDRRDFTSPGRPLSGYGVGLSILTGSSAPTCRAGSGRRSGPASTSRSTCASEALNGRGIGSLRKSRIHRSGVSDHPIPLPFSFSGQSLTT
jgi:hypothetical protein